MQPLSVAHAVTPYTWTIRPPLVRSLAVSTVHRPTTSPARTISKCRPIDHHSRLPRRAPLRPPLCLLFARATAKWTPLPCSVSTWCIHAGVGMPEIRQQHTRPHTGIHASTTRPARSLSPSTNRPAKPQHCLFPHAPRQRRTPKRATRAAAHVRNPSEAPQPHIRSCKRSQPCYCRLRYGIRTQHNAAAAFLLHGAVPRSRACCCRLRGTDRIPRVAELRLNAATSILFLNEFLKHNSLVVLGQCSEGVDFKEYAQHSRHMVASGSPHGACTALQRHAPQRSPYTMCCTGSC
jgi:hypothetical protein